MVKGWSDWGGDGGRYKYGFVCLLLPSSLQSSITYNLLFSLLTAHVLRYEAARRQWANEV